MPETTLPSFEHLPVPPALARLRRFPMDGALLLFDRDSGTNALCEGPETAHLRQRAPRALQFGITNRCNLACTFCSRDVEAGSTWTADEAFGMLAGLAEAGVLEVAFGGGEPWVFPRFEELVCRLYDETPLAVSFTTNGLALNARRLAAIRGRYGQCRLSLYEDNDWRRKVAELADAGARFGVNYLVTPERLAVLETVVLELVSRGSPGARTSAPGRTGRPSPGGRPCRTPGPSAIKCSCTTASPCRSHERSASSSTPGEGGWRPSWSTRTMPW